MKKQQLNDLFKDKVIGIKKKTFLNPNEHSEFYYFKRDSIGDKIGQSRKNESIVVSVKSLHSDFKELSDTIWIKLEEMVPDLLGRLNPEKIDCKKINELLEKQFLDVSDTEKLKRDAQKKISEKLQQLNPNCIVKVRHFVGCLQNLKSEEHARTLASFIASTKNHKTSKLNPKRSSDINGELQKDFDQSVIWYNDNSKDHQKNILNMLQGMSIEHNWTVRIFVFNVEKLGPEQIGQVLAKIKELTATNEKEGKKKKRNKEMEKKQTERQTEDSQLMTKNTNTEEEEVSLDESNKIKDLVNICNDLTPEQFEKLMAMAKTFQQENCNMQQDGNMNESSPQFEAGKLFF